MAWDALPYFHCLRRASASKEAVYGMRGKARYRICYWKKKRKKNGELANFLFPNLPEKTDSIGQLLSGIATQYQSMKD